MQSLPLDPSMHLSQVALDPWQSQQIANPHLTTVKNLSVPVSPNQSEEIKSPREGVWYALVSAVKHGARRNCNLLRTLLHPCGFQPQQISASCRARLIKHIPKATLLHYNWVGLGQGPRIWLSSKFSYFQNHFCSLAKDKPGASQRKNRQLQRSQWHIWNSNQHYHLWAVEHFWVALWSDPELVGS
jgi:hypothetical protein